MTLAIPAATALRADPAFAAVIVTTRQPSKTVVTEFGQKPFVNDRIVRTVYLYNGPDVQYGPHVTSHRPTLYAACYGATDTQAHELAELVRAALHEQTLDRYAVRWTDTRQATEDRGYNPPEWYGLVRFIADGLWEL